MESVIIYKQDFNVKNHKYVGIVEQNGNDTYIVLQEDGEEIERVLYNNEIDDYTMMLTIENLIQK